MEDDDDDAVEQMGQFAVLFLMLVYSYFWKMMMLFTLAKLKLGERAGQHLNAIQYRGIIRFPRWEDISGRIITWQ